MSLSQTQLLGEMGLSPRWLLRSDPAVSRRDPAAHEPPSPAAAVSTVNAVPPVHAERPPRASATPATPVRNTVDTSESAAARAERIARMDWAELRQSISDCRACGLCAERKQAVPGVGDEQAGWLFIGEGPGAEEDARGEPFVGPAGKLLDAMLAAIDLQRGQNVYIANAVKCRPPGNRTPEAAEMAACAPYLQRQMELLQPQLVVLLGRAAVHAVLAEDASLASMRGKTLSYALGDRQVPVVVSYHPAYLLRNLPDKSKAWEDLCRARALMRAAATSSV